MSEGRVPGPAYKGEWRRPWKWEGRWCVADLLKRVVFEHLEAEDAATGEAKGREAIGPAQCTLSGHTRVSPLSRAAL